MVVDGDGVYQSQYHQESEQLRAPGIHVVLFVESLLSDFDDWDCLLLVVLLSILVDLTEFSNDGFH